MAYDKEGFVRRVGEITANDSSGHDVEHSGRVYSWARKIALRENTVFDDEKLHAACYGHDMGYTNPKAAEDNYVSHPKYSNEIISAIIEYFGFPSEKMSDLKEIIRVHDFTKPWAIDSGLFEETNILEAKLLQDADNIEGYGLLGMLRVALYSQKVGMKLYIPHQFADYGSSRKSIFANMLYHTDFKGRMNFKSAQRIMHTKKMSVNAYIAELKEEFECE